MRANWSAIILAGGTSRRFGSDKSQARLSEYSLLDEILHGLPFGLPVIVVGPGQPTSLRTVQMTREQPINGGPVAGISAGLLLVQTDLVGVIATDMPFAAPLISHLVDELPDEADCIVPIDAAGFQQPLCAVYRVEALEKALAQLGEPYGQSMRNLITLLNVHGVIMGDDAQNALIDIDTPSDLEHAVAIHGEMQDNLANERQ
jgi:molybdopterin-guanine dinucleotide biosynthesis protein A